MTLGRFFRRTTTAAQALDDAATALQGMRNQLEHALLAKEISMKTLRRIQKVCTNLACLEDTLTKFAARKQVELLHPSFLSPIRKEVMRDLVVAADSFTYERNSIEKHFKKIEQDPPGNFGSDLEHLIHLNQAFRYRDGMAQWAGVVGDSDDEDESNPVVELDVRESFHLEEDTDSCHESVALPYSVPGIRFFLQVKRFSLGGRHGRHGFGLA